MKEGQEKIYYVFPAPAGINRKRQRNHNPPLRVPRASGDKPSLLTALALRQACSPRQRG
ncbi:hypothetical protein J8K08_003645 [Salmonella enterica]|nr:hypothetical protein [Salmonella enterica]EEC4891816.1 hypothetical protein [Salmonella enterica subsp. enterica serovar Oslo]EEI7937324.1 hypothetical protein [Salmonella enterica]EEL1493289.1 hypothetical protein [Salmonella enterica]EEP6038941.1 hypothetical protein [Salmonella enterica]EFA3205408.1 hypothetical protein [Salmonella enterica]